jgi:hypothetical protein
MSHRAIRSLAGLLVVLLLALVSVACGGGQASTLVTYQRAWPDGFNEELALADDGKVTMHHGETLERMTIDSADVQRIRDALAAGIPDGESADGLVRSLILGNGTTHTPVQVVPGTVTELLEELMTTHSLTGSPPPANTPAPVHTVGASSAL